MGEIIQSVAKLSLDIEKDIRKECFKVLGMILTAAPLDFVRPFFDILSSYIRCAMTHIQPSIQEDSLLMLDTLITHVPTLLSTNSDKIFLSFLNMMSKLRIESKPERTLTVNLSSKLTSIKWRTKILERLHKILQAIINEKKAIRKVNIVHVTNAAENLVEDAFALDGNDQNIMKDKSDLNMFNSSAPMHFPIYRGYLNRNCSLPGLFQKSITDSGVSSQMEGVDEGKTVKNYVETLMPLLYETWLEVRPNFEENHDKLESIMSNEAAFSLKFILEIIQQLYELISMWEIEVNNHDLSQWFRSTYSEDFTQHFVLGFPYVQSEQRKVASTKGTKIEEVKNRDIDASGGFKCYPQNFAICMIFGFFNQKIETKELRNSRKILNYVNGEYQL